MLKENEHLLDYLHISDQFSGLKPQDQEEQVVEPPKVKRVLNIALKSQFQFLFCCVLKLETKLTKNKNNKISADIQPISVIKCKKLQ